MSAAIINYYTDSLPSDFRAEIIAAEMVESGMPLDRLLIVMLGGSKRTYRKDVGEIIEELSEYDHKEYTHIKTHKEGLYDKLPEGLFHYPTLPKSATTDSEIIKAIKKHHEEEKTARLFFLPFEAAINDQRIQMALSENLLDKRVHNTKLVDIFSGQWEIFDYLDGRQSNIFLHLLPLIYDIRDNYEAAEYIFELILQIPVQIAVLPQAPVKSEIPFYSTLDDAVLGVNFTTGNEVFITGEDEITISVGPMNNETLTDFMPNGKSAKILELLCDFLLPVHLDIKTVLNLYPPDKSTRLTDGMNDYNSTLGLCTYL